MRAPAYMQLRDAAAFVGLSPVTLRRAVARGELRALMTSSGRTHRLLFRSEDLIAWVERTCVPAHTITDEADAIVAAELGGRRRR